MLRSPAWATTWSILRLAVAALLAAAIITQAVVSTSQAAAAHRDVTTTVVNFFSFFTILSNVLSVIVLTWGAVWFLRRGRRDRDVEPRALALALAGTTTYMIVTGVVYNTLLRGVELPIGARPVPWSNESLHVIGPIFLLLDLFLAARRRGLRWRAIPEILVFPLVWVVYTMVRGPLAVNPMTGQPWWYPYPFLNPHNFDAGYGTVALYVIGIAVLISGFAALVVWIGRRRARRGAASA